MTSVGSHLVASRFGSQLLCKRSQRSGSCLLIRAKATARLKGLIVATRAFRGLAVIWTDTRTGTTWSPTWPGTPSSWA